MTLIITGNILKLMMIIENYKETTDKRWLSIYKIKL